MSDRRELYRSPNGDTWSLGREPENGRAFIIHQPNGPSGGRLSHIELGEFLRNSEGPEQKALLRLIGSLVNAPPFGEAATQEVEQLHATEKQGGAGEPATSELEPEKDGGIAGP